jgi:L-lactate dehydrogenase
MRIGVVGMGWVGSSVAISTLQSGLPTELLVSDMKPGLAEGEAMDLAHGAAFYATATVRAARPDEMLDADAVVVSAGRGGKPGESRLDLLRDNAGIVRDIARGLARLRGLLVVVTNPVDVMTHVAVEASGLPPSRVIGTGTMLDTARLRQILGRELRLEPRSIHAQVVGEHGDSSVALWSSAQVGGVPLRAWRGWHAEREAAIAGEVRGAAGAIIARKGATNHAIGLVTAALLRWALRGERRVLNVSRVQEGAFGLRDVALSLPTVVGAEGAVEVLEPRMDGAERAALERSAGVLRAARASLG